MLRILFATAIEFSGKKNLCPPVEMPAFRDIVKERVGGILLVGLYLITRVIITPSQGDRT